MTINYHNFWDFIGNENIIHYWQNCLRTRKFVHTYLFIGPYHLGKSFLVSKLVAAILCIQPNADGAPCGSCAPCQQLAKNIHPDYYQLLPDSEKDTISIERVRQWQKSIATKPFYNSYKIGFIEEVDKMSEEAANALLKTIEEPVGQTIIFITGIDENNILPTIKSRGQLFRWRRVNNQILFKHFAYDCNELSATRRDVVYCADGRPGRVIQLLADPRAQLRELNFVQTIIDLILATSAQKMTLLDNLSKIKDGTYQLENIIERTAIIARCLLGRKILGSSYYDSLIAGRDLEWPNLLSLINKLQNMKERKAYNQNQKLVLEDLFLMT